MTIRRLLALLVAGSAAACNSAPSEVHGAHAVVGPEIVTQGTGGGASVADLTGTGTARIDGVLSPGEWDHAGFVDFAANAPSSAGGGTVPARLYAMNDGVNLYFAVRSAAPTNGAGSFVVDIDANGDGVLSAGDDAVVSSGDTWAGQWFADDFSAMCGEALCSYLDTAGSPGIAPGTSDGAGSFVSSGGFTVSEIAHPLASGDVLHDVQVKFGDRLGFRIFLRNIDSCPSWPACFGDTSYPLVGEVTMIIQGAVQPPPPPPPVEPPPPPPVEPPPPPPPPPAEPPPPAPPAPTPVRIDVKPAHPDTPAPIQLAARGKVPVALLGSPSFDVATVEVASVRFAGAPVAARPDGRLMAATEDVDRDGHPDLVLHFEASALLLASDATVAELTGTAGGAPFVGRDAIRIVP